MKKIIPEDRLNLKALIQNEIKSKGTTCNLNSIDVSKITDMSFVFADDNCTFNGDISQWDVSNVTTMYLMFCESDFNGDISNWNVRNVQDMGAMFFNAQFKGDLNLWKPHNLRDSIGCFEGCLAPTPYWANKKDNLGIQKSISSHLLYNQLNDKMEDCENNLSFKKNKI